MTENGWLKYGSLMLAGGIFITGLCAGCSKKQTEPTQQKKQSAKTEIQKVQPEQKQTAVKDNTPTSPEYPSKDSRTELPSELQSGAEKAAEQAKNEIPLRLSALMSMGDVSLAGLVDTETGNEAMVQKGNIFHGYSVLEVNEQEKTVLLEKDGKQYTLHQTGDADARKTVTQNPLLTNTNIPSVFAKPNLKNVPMPHYEPTQDEISRGIDPNNPKTWPKGYKGPAIERFLAQMTPEERAAAEKPGITPEMIQEQYVEPTDGEIAQGIDPNDSSTWPADYKGPAIEDFLAEHPEEAAKLEQGGIQPGTLLQGYEPTPEEAARGIDPNDPATWPADYRGPGIEDAIAEQKLKEQQKQQNQ